MTTAGLILIGVLLFELIILFHEGGHFVAAKLSGVKVNEFSLGMGPKLFSFKKGETTYSLRLLPIGGFCAMEGEDEDSQNPRAFNNAKIFKRMIIIVAGAAMNILLGLILMLVTLLPSESFSTNHIHSFVPQSFSANCGLEVGDKIVSVNGYKVNNSMDLSYAFAKLKVQNVDGDSLQIYKQDCANALFNLFRDNDFYGELSEEEFQNAYSELQTLVSNVNISNDYSEADTALSDGVKALNSYFKTDSFEIPEISVRDTRMRFRTDLTVERNGERLTLEDVDFYTYTTADDPEPKMSIDFYSTAKDKTFLTLIQQTGSQTVSVVRMVADSLWGLVTGQFGINDVSGPIGAASATVEVAQQGLKSSFGDAVLNIVYIMMVITVNLGVVNMLPFPALDGGRFVFLLIEAIFRKPIPRKAEAIVNAVGLGLLLLFIFIISLKDIWMLIL
ncbi:MAG: RIP metalloprotease RseP [Ruminococcus sp.]|nr:RIP metalloprotease RseP [Ruminococcus sp.]